MTIFKKPFYLSFTYPILLQAMLSGSIWFVRKIIKIKSKKQEKNINNLLTDQKIIAFNTVQCIEFLEILWKEQL